jgi:antitoxin FitA
MASLVIRNLEDPLKAKLRVRAAKNGRSMEAEVRSILRRALAVEAREPAHIVNAIRERFARLGGVDLEPVDREPLRAPPTFDS